VKTRKKPVAVFDIRGALKTSAYTFRPGIKNRDDAVKKHGGRAADTGVA
jgi:hypothetical protein